jgi:hypothetical protein
MSHARECVRLAKLTDYRDVRDQLLDIAQRWTLAAQSERRSHHARVVPLHKLRNQAKPRRQKRGPGNVKEGGAGGKRR